MPIDPTTAGEAIGGALILRTVTVAVGRVVGPASDEIAQGLRRYTEFRLRNVGKFAEHAERKATHSGRVGEVPPRVAHQLLEAGSYCDDELMAEYLGGVLAGARTPTGRDDRAAVWSSLITSLSSYQIRAHYLLYREWADLLRGRIDVPPGVDTGRQQANMCLPVSEFAGLLIQDADDDANEVMAHAIPGLVRFGLLEPAYYFGPRDGDGSTQPNAPWPAILTAGPSVAGIELYGWAQGVPSMYPQTFALLAEPFDTAPQIPRVPGAYLPALVPPRPDE